MEKIEELYYTIMEQTYPIGSIYISTNNTNPSQLFGGCWIPIKDAFLLGAGNTYNNGSTGGSADAVVVSHSHGFTAGGGSLNIYTNSGVITHGFNGGNLWRDTNKYPSSIASTGVDGTGKNMPPYYTVNVWKRVESTSDITSIYLPDANNPFTHNCPHTVTYNSSSGFTQIRINEGNTSNTGSRYYMSIPFSARPNNVTVSVDFYTTGMSNDDFGVRICDKKTMDSSGAYDSYGAWIITGQGRLAYGYGGRETANVKYGDYLGSVGNNIQYNYTMKISKNTAYYCLKRLDTGAIISEKTYTRTDTYQFSGQYYLYIGGGKFSTGSADKSVYIKNLIIG